PTYQGVTAQHANYVAALREAGLKVDVLPPLEDFPDSTFVEDPALTFPEGAILLRPGAPSRAAEPEHLRDALARHFAKVIEIGPDEPVDGGDVLVTPEIVFIGLSKRTSLPGAKALQRKLRELGRASRISETPPGVLHFKTVSSLVAENAILCTTAAASFFDGFKVLIAPEDAAANAIRVNDTVFVGAEYPRTIAMLRAEGLTVTPIPVSEIAKLDAGLSCMSLRW
ncbi:dimethylarginine dimethylaminohydrolase family protein, partial [Paraburkholderia sp.]|uniref:dimethylarginine dimethylaminohydrolase family protein n=1 Tax=Paraburkholderia sp. TaxID=1926495 RepID=UPI002F409CE6